MCNERCREPSLDELFGDIAMRLLMRRDGTTESDIRTLLCRLKDARGAASGGTRHGPGFAESLEPALDRTEVVAGGRVAKSSEAAKTRLRLI
jgi:hypothetical protein